MSVARPPRLAERLVGASLEKEDREFALGDLAQAYVERRRRSGWLIAASWYWWQAARSLTTQWGHGGEGGGSGGARHGDGPERGTRRAGLVDAMSRDARHALRSFTRAPGFTLAAVTTLALGIGATTGVFSLADGVLFRPLPGVEEPDDLAFVSSCTATPRGCAHGGITYPNFLDIQSRLRLIAGIAGYGSAAGNPEVVAEGGVGHNLDPLYVTASYFDVLGTRPMMGRTFTEEEDDPSGGAPVVVISRRLWSALFNRAPDVLGRDLRINGHRLTVIGVMPRGFRGVGPGRRDLWLPRTTMGWINRWSTDFADRRSGNSLGYFLVRRAPGASWEQVKAELDSFLPWLAEQHPIENAEIDRVIFRVNPGLGQRGPQVVGVLVALFAVIGLILLIACSNVAGLLVIRGLRRRGEVAVRKALGASRGRLLRQHLTESVMLWLAGGAAGGLLTLALVRIAESRVPLSDLVFPMNLRVLTFTGIVSLVVGLLFGALPALGAARVDASRWLGQAAPVATGGRRWMRAGLCVVQLAATLTLLVGALLMARTLKGLYDIDLGFEPADVTLFEVSLGEERFDDVSRMQYLRAMTERLRADGRVVEVSTAWMVPITGHAGISTSVIVAGEAEASARAALSTHVGLGYFEALQTPIVAGRAFTDEEVLPTLPSESVVLSESVARALFGDADPLGRHIQLPRSRDAARRYRVVGIAGDVRFQPRSLSRGVDPMIYLPLGADGSVPRSATFIVRARPGAEGIARLIRSTAAGLDAELPVTGMEAHSDLVASFFGPSALIASLTGATALLAAFLAAVGLYGVIGVAAAERTWEFGIRVALGADHGALRRLVATEAISIVAPGLLAGLVGAFALGIVIEGFLYGVSPLDPLSWILATLLLAVVTMIAIAAPVRRATTVDPVKVLRAG